MPGRDERSLTALLLTSHLVPRDVKPLRASQFWRLIDRFDELERLPGASPREIEAETGVTADEAHVISELLKGAASFAFEVEDLERRGITLLSAIDERYPAAFRTKLGSAAPPVLYVAGAPELLASEGVAIVGARDVDPNAAHVAGDAARLLASRGLTVYSGAAKGIDQVAMNSAFSAGGVVVGVLADSLERRLGDPDTRRAILDERVCLCTPYKPNMGFTVANAMARNKLIYALARKTFV
ncbi:MAG TPA: DNA-processing protein DprA, partial [Actinomycetota bacterium]|nr:DNA-processing protein DprA [Actinomycetota bacterium]